MFSPLLPWTTPAVHMCEHAQVVVAKRLTGYRRKYAIRYVAQLSSYSCTYIVCAASAAHHNGLVAFDSKPMRPAGSCYARLTGGEALTVCGSFVVDLTRVTKRDFLS